MTQATTQQPEIGRIHRGQRSANVIEDGLKHQHPNARQIEVNAECTFAALYFVELPALCYEIMRDDDPRDAIIAQHRGR